MIAVFVLLAAIPMGVVAAVKNGKWVDMAGMPGTEYI